MKGKSAILILGLVLLLGVLAGCRVFDPFGNGLEHVDIAPSGGTDASDPEGSYKLSYLPATNSVMITGNAVKTAEIASDSLVLIITASCPISVGSILADMENGQYLRRVIEIASTTESLAANGTFPYSICVRTEDAYLDEAFQEFRLSMKGKLSDLVSRPSLHPAKILLGSTLAAKTEKLEMEIETGLGLDAVDVDWDFDLHRGCYFKAQLLGKRVLKGSINAAIKVGPEDEFSFPVPPLLSARYVKVSGRLILAPTGSMKGSIKAEQPYTIDCRPDIRIEWGDKDNFSFLNSDEGAGISLDDGRVLELSWAGEGKAELGYALGLSCQLFGRPLLIQDMPKFAYVPEIKGEISGKWVKEKDAWEWWSGKTGQGYK